MDIRILGPLEVVDGGTPVPLGGPKPRAVLAALALQPGCVISTDRLAQAVWGDHAPPGALGALRAYISRLRTVLPDGKRRLNFRAPGYALRISDGELDAARFTVLVDEGRARMEAGDHVRALDLLDTALALWRGEPLGEFDASDVDPTGELARLAELKLVAIEERGEALVRLARGREIVSQFEGLVRAYPERERLSALLMRALYAAGRQADALAVYRALRARLVRELGVEPAESTQAVHRQLLEQDPGLSPPASPSPTNLPRRPTEFVNRREEIATLSAAIRTGPLVTLTGPGGIGKSRLAAEVAALNAAHFADGVWWTELAPLPDHGPVGQVVAATLGVRQGQGRTLEQSIVEFLRPRRLLLVLDNCEHVVDASARLVSALLAHCPEIVILATSRESLSVPGEQRYPVPPLTDDHASTLFVMRARATRPDFNADRSGSTIARVCQRLDGLPLAIELAAARMRAMTVTDLADRLDDARLLAQGPRSDFPRHQSMAAAIDWSYRLLTEPEGRLFARMSVFAGGADLAAVHAVCADPGTTEIDTLELITALVDKSLITATAGPRAMRYGQLETLRAYGRDRVPPNWPVADRHADFFVRLATQAAQGAHGPNEGNAIQRALGEAANLRAAFGWLHARRDADRALALVSALPEVFQIRLGYEAASWAEQALQLADDHHPQFVAAVGAAARGAWNLGEFDRAGELARRAGGRRPPPGTARTGYPGDVLADIALYNGRPDTALRHYAEEVVDARRRDEPVRLVWTLYYVAVCHAAHRTPELGEPAARESLDIARRTANPTALSMAHYALGLVLKKADPVQALELLEEAARLAESVGNFWRHGIALMEAAATRAVHGKAAEAATDAVTVLDHWERVGDRTQQWLHLRYVVRLLVRLGALDDALALHHCLLAAGRPSALSPRRADTLIEQSRARAAATLGGRLTAAGAAELARRSLLRHA